MAITNYFEFTAASVNYTATSLVEGFFGSYSGLSLFNQNDVIHIQVSASVQEFFLAPSAASMGITWGYKIYPNLSTIDLPPMRVGSSSSMVVQRTNTGGAMSANNASWNWVIWRRIDGPIPGY